MKIEIESEKLVQVFQLLAEIELKLENDESVDDLYDRVSVMVTNLNVFLLDNGCNEHC